MLFFNDEKKYRNSEIFHSHIRKLNVFQNERREYDELFIILVTVNEKRIFTYQKESGMLC